MMPVKYSKNTESTKADNARRLFPHSLWSFFSRAVASWSTITSSSSSGKGPPGRWWPCSGSLLSPDSLVLDADLVTEDSTTDGTTAASCCTLATSFGSFCVPWQSCPSSMTGLRLEFISASRTSMVFHLLECLSLWTQDELIWVDFPNLMRRNFMLTFKGNTVALAPHAKWVAIGCNFNR